MTNLVDEIRKNTNESCIYLGYSEEELEKGKAEIRKPKSDFEDLVIEINPEDYNIFYEFAKKFPYCEPTVRIASIEEHLKYQIVSELASNPKKEDYMNLQDYQKRWKSLKNREFDVENAFTNDEPNLFSFIEELALGENHIRINIFVNRVRDIELQRIINSLLLKHTNHIIINLYTTGKDLVSYGLFYASGDVLHEGEDYREVMPEPLREEKKKKMTIENDQNKIVVPPKPITQINRFYDFSPDFVHTTTYKPLTSIEGINYYGLEEVMELLPISVLPISDTILEEYKDCSSLKELYERMYLETYSQKFIGTSRRICLMGFDLFKKKNLYLVQKGKLGSTDIAEKMSENSSYFDPMLERFPSLCEFIVEFLSESRNKKLRFLPIMNSRTSGSYEAFANSTNLRKAIIEDKNQVAKSIVRYSSPKNIKSMLEGDYEDGVKRLTLTSSRYQNIIKKSWQ